MKTKKTSPVKTGNSPVQLACPVMMQEGEGRPGFAMLGYTGALITCFWDDFIIDLNGMTAADRFAILRQHAPDRIVGVATSWNVDAEGFHILGEFSDVTDDAREVLALGREGYPWQCSIGVWPLEVTRLASGSKATVNGREISGPCDIWTKSQVRECSFVTLGADKDTSATILQEGDSMDKRLKDRLVSLGMPEGATEEEALAFMDTLSVSDRQQLEEPTAAEPQEPERLNVQEEVSKAVEKALSEERERTMGIRKLAARFGLTELAEKLCGEKISLQDAREKILSAAEEKLRPVGSGRYDVTLAESDKLRPLAAEGMFLRAGGRIEKPTPGSEQFQHMSLSNLARFFLQRDGINALSLSDSEVARRILGGDGRMLASRSDFKAIFADVAHRRLVQAYRESPATWRPFVTVVSASDFKPIQGISLSSAPNLLEVKEGAEYKTGDLKESQESYRIAKYGRILSLTYEMIVDDDLRAFARIPGMFGASAARLYADLVYGIFSANPKMSDGNALFSAAHNNLVSTGSAPSADSLTDMRVMLRKQTGLGGETLDLQPRTVLLPLELETNAEIILRSTALPQADMSSGVYNPWANRLTPIADPRLSAQSTTAWYMLADPRQIDFIEMAFLDGQETPTIEEDQDFDTDTFRYKARTSAGVGVMDWRGVVKNPGASS